MEKIIDIDEEYVLNKYLAGMTCRELADEYKCSETHIRNYLSKLPNYTEIKKKHKEKIRIKKVILPICSYIGCNRKAHSRKSLFCSKHESVNKNIQLQNEIKELKIKKIYQRKNTIFTQYEDTNFFSIKLGKHDCITLVDNEFYDKCKEHCWNLHHQGYAETRIDKKVILLHNFILNKNNHEEETDHINRNRLDNRKYNLRIVTKSQNKTNAGIYSNNTSGVTGVSWDKSRNKWHVMITVDKKHINLGRYHSFEEATQVRLDAEKLYHGEYAPIERRGDLNETDNENKEAC